MTISMTYPKAKAKTH